MLHLFVRQPRRTHKANSWCVGCGGVISLSLSLLDPLLSHNTRSKNCWAIFARRLGAARPGRQPHTGVRTQVCTRVGGTLGKKDHHFVGNRVGVGVSINAFVCSSSPLAPPPNKSTSHHGCRHAAVPVAVHLRECGAGPVQAREGANRRPRRRGDNVPHSFPLLSSPTVHPRCHWLRLWHR